MTTKCIIIGASHAAAQLAASLRQEDWDGQILMIGDQPHLPYHRPPLSKTYLTEGKNAQNIAIRPAAFYEKKDIQFQRGCVTTINRAQKSLTLDDGQDLSYDKLALCVGSRVRKVSLPGAALEGIYYLREIADVEGIKDHVGEGKRAVIVGGGYIGLEMAATLRQMGMDVVVLEMASRVLQRVTAPELSEFYSRVHHEEGVAIHTEKSVSEISGNGHVEKVICADGSQFPADLVVIGVGIQPNMELAEKAGLTTDDGIVVDEFCRTDDPDIVAAGDCTNHFNPIYDRRIRLESVPNAGEQAKVAAAAICGVDKPSRSLPWFWSNQYDIKLQIAGLSAGYDRVVIRGDRHTGRSFAAFYLQDGRLIAADCVNRPQEFMLSKKIISEQRDVSPERFADESITVKELMQDE